MEKQIIELRTDLLKERFDEENAGLIVEWLIAAENRRPVLLVGAGLSRCAKFKNGQGYVKPKDVPLWNDLAKKMATHLRIDSGKYDPPTMAEMYEASFGKSELRNLLFNSLSDDALDPGEAHCALGEYDPEAIITTNCLDTLLDKVEFARGRRNRVIADANLSGSADSKQRSIDLIYFHGHRCAPDSWVITRSEYEDVQRKRPVVLARVRQVMAQNPLLILGFGMSDPNFHNVYRQISNEMHEAQPLGLAVQLAEASEAERRHWDRLGIRIAVPNDCQSLRKSPETANAFFQWLLKQLATLWSPEEKVVLEYVRKESRPAERLARFHAIAPHLWKGRISGEFSQNARDEAFSAWLDILFSLLSKDETTEAEKSARNALERMHRILLAKVQPGAEGPGQTGNIETSGPRRDSPETGNGDFQELPGWNLLDRGDASTWKLDKLLAGKLRGAPTIVADYFELALERGLFRSRPAEYHRLPWIPLTFWLATQDATRSESRRQEIGNLCSKMAAKYRDDHLQALILDIAKTANVDLKDGAVQEAADSPQQDGHKALLRHDYAIAKVRYREAAGQAFASNQVFEEWVWRHGELESAQGEMRTIDPWRLRTSGSVAAPETELDRELDQIEARVHVLKVTAEVKAWLDLTAERVRRALEFALQQQKTRDRYRATGGEGASFSDSLYTAWRSFRDLETLWAPPALLCEHLAPLLWSSGFSPGGELELRITLEVRETREWFTTILDSQCESIEEQQKRDDDLLDAFWRVLGQQQSQKQRLWTLGVLSGLRCGFRTSDAKRLVEWAEMSALKDAAGISQDTAIPATVGGPRPPDRDAYQGLETIALFGRPAWARKIFEERWRTSSWSEKDDLAAFSYGLPWNRWGLQEPDEIVPWLETTAAIYEDLKIPHAAPSSTYPIPDIYKFDELLPFAVLRMTMGLIHASSEVLGEVRAKLLKFAERIHARPARGSIWWEAHRAGFLLENELLAEAEKSGVELLRRWLNGAATTQPEDTRYAQELNWSLLADAFDEVPHKDSGLLEILEEHWAAIRDEAAWRPVERHYCLNPFSADPLIRMLSTCLVHLPNTQGTIAPRLQQLLSFAPNALPHIVATLSPEIWGESWGGLVEQVVSSAGGFGRRRQRHSWMEDAGRGTLHQIGAIDLWDGHMRRLRKGSARGTDGKGIRELLGCLRSAAVLGVSDDRAAVANHAAHALVIAAEVVEEGEETILLAGALRRVSRDSRVAVRAAGAYAAARLPTLARSRAIRDVAVEIGKALVDDLNAMVVLQRELGRLEADRASRDEELS